jgi:hypothetical protein
MIVFKDKLTGEGSNLIPHLSFSSKPGVYQRSRGYCRRFPENLVSDNVL